MSVNRNILYTFLSQLPAQILSFLTGLFLVRLLGAEGRGVYAIVTADVDLFCMFLGFSINSGLAYFISSEKIAPKKALGLAIWIVVVGTAVLGVVMYGLYANRVTAFLFPENHDTLFYFTYVMAGFALTMTNTVFTGIFQGVQRFRYLNQVNLFNAGLNLVVFGGAFAWAYYSDLEVTVKQTLWFTLGILFVNTLFWFVVYFRVVGWVPDMRVNYRKDLVPFFSYIGPGHLSSMINFLNYRLDLWVLDHYCPSAEVGFYAMAVGLAQRLWIIPNAMSLVLLPHMSGKGIGEGLGHLRLLTRVNNTAVLGLALIAAPVSMFFFPIAYGEEFIASVLPFQLILPGILFSCTTKLYSTYLASRGLVNLNLHATVIGLVVTVVFDLWLIPIYGATGASLATGATYLSILWYVHYQMRLKANLGWRGTGLMGLGDIREMREMMANRNR